MRRLIRLSPLMMMHLLQIHALVARVDNDSRGRLCESFSSPSGKLTFAPELVIPEPRDATGILLQANAVQTLSSRIRSCKASAAFVRSSISEAATLCIEQQSNRGSFPGPVPIVYCIDDAVEIEAIANAGVDGIFVQVAGGAEIRSVDDISGDWIETAEMAMSNDLQVIPEFVVSENVAGNWSEQDLLTIIDAVIMALKVTPVCLVITVNAVVAGASNNDISSGSPTFKSNEPPLVLLPQIPKSLTARIPVLGSVRIRAGDGRIGDETARLKDAGFTGAFLRSECLPGYRFHNPLDLDTVGQFWASCIEDLKSVKSKNFSFRSKNNMEKRQSTVWANYQNSVIESGALGDPNDSYSIVYSQAGEYKGFA